VLSNKIHRNKLKIKVNKENTNAVVFNNIVLYDGIINNKKTPITGKNNKVLRIF